MLMSMVYFYWALFRYQAFDMLYLFLFSKQVRCRYYYHPFVQMRKFILKLLTILSSPREPLRNLIFLLCCTPLFCSFHITFSLVTKRIFELWESIPFILLCGKEYVQRLNSWLYIVLYSVFLKLSKVNLLF